MARRRKDIKKRRKAKEEQHLDTPPDEMGEDLAEGSREIEEPFDDDVTLKADIRRKISEPEKIPSRPAGTEILDDRKKDVQVPPSGWFGRNRENLLLAFLVLYVLLLGLGTMGELFEIEWILNLPIFR